MTSTEGLLKTKVISSVKKNNVYENSYYHNTIICSF